ncbi:MAG TPA: VOC family protein [Sphingobium sp.]|uniref:VOC family protein n=1 Tax=Sphingobium sp. TaxID=1912891 RepID=UPI002ED67F4E
MTVQTLDHVNLRVRDVEATAGFFVDVLGMQRSAERATWILDASGHPAIHLGSPDSPYPSDAWRPFIARDDGGAVHHVALACTGYEDVVARLEAHGLQYDTNAIGTVLRQIFVAEPGGVLLELNFRVG